jgi:hypothetical protein
VTVIRAPNLGPREQRRWAAPRAPRTAVERRTLLDTLEHPVDWPAAAAALLAELGFRLIEPEQVAGDDSHLLIALRDRPTLRHFDPETIAYYAPRDGGAILTTIDRATAARAGGRVQRRALWGHVHVMDRIPVENRFLTFGGDLRIATVDPALTVVDLSASGPIVRWGGHSQGIDPLTAAIGAFFGRLIVPVDFVPGAERRIDATPPEVLYRAFLADHRERARLAAQRGTATTDLDGRIAAAWARARDDDQAASAAADDLLRELDFN